MQNKGLMLVMEDYNARHGQSLDYIDGIVNVPNRNVIDTVVNSYE